MLLQKDGMNSFVERIYLQILLQILRVYHMIMKTYSQSNLKDFFHLEMEKIVIRQREKLI